MRILLVCSRYPPAVGGVETHVQTLGQLLSRRGHQVRILTSDVETVTPFRRIRDEKVSRIAPPIPDVSRVVGYPVIPTVDSLGVFAPGFLGVSSMADQFDVVHLHSYGYSSSLLPTLVPGMRRHPVVITPHTLADPRLRRRLYDSTLGPWTLRFARRVIALTNSEAHFLSTIGVAPVRIRVIPNGVELSRLRAVPNEPRASPDSPPHPRIAFVGRMTRSKGVRVLVDAVATLVTRHPYLELLLIGPRSAYSRQVNSQISASGLQRNIRFVSNLSREEYVEMLRSSSALVLPSLTGEAQGVVLLEAMALDVPIVASDIGGIPETVGPDIASSLVRPGDSLALAGAIERVLSDPSFRDRLIVAGRKHIVRYDWSDLVVQIEQVYREAIVES